MAAVEWIVTMKEGLHLIAEHPDAVLPVKYEDYVKSSDLRRRSVEFCGLSMDEKYDEYCSKVLSGPCAKSKNCIACRNRQWVQPRHGGAGL